MKLARSVWWSVLAGIGLSCASASRPATSAAPAPERRLPNFVILLADDLGYGDLGAYGHPKIKTPHLDRLAASGLRLTDYHADMPVCSPSRAALLTGRNPNRYGIYDWISANSGVFLPREEITVARLLKSAKYRTAHIGKWHLSSRLDGSEPTPADHGFDHWFSTQNNAAPSHQDPINFVRNGQRVGPVSGHSSAVIADEAIRVMNDFRAEPFALFVWFHATHEPIATPKVFTDMYTDPGDAPASIYYGSVSLLDQEVGRLLRALDSLGLREDTFVMFASDNGPASRTGPGTSRSYGSPGPLRGMKLSLYEGGHRVPAFIRWPRRLRPGQVSDEPVFGTDLLPTLCEIAGIDVPRDRALDGASWVPLFERHPISRRVPMYWEYVKTQKNTIANRQDKWQYALRQGEWKLLADASLGAFELYNLLSDRAETTDLAGRHAERVAALAQELRRRRADVHATRASSSPQSAAAPVRDSARIPN